MYTVYYCSMHTTTVCIHITVPIVTNHSKPITVYKLQYLYYCILFTAIYTLQYTLYSIYTTIVFILQQTKCSKCNLYYSIHKYTAV